MNEALRELAPAVIVAAVWGLAIFATWWALLGRAGARRQGRLASQMALVGLGVVALVSVVYALPLSDSWRENLPGLLGLGLSAMVALASTTLVANVMAGLMLRLVGAFRIGDFIRVDEHFGRVSERGLLHTEIQTEDRDLVTLPNVFVISNPTRVVRGSGTIISAELSLGYDVDHARLEPLLAAAARRTGLADPVVQVKALLDHAVAYRVAGFLENPKQLITTRSLLQRNVLDTLHRAGIEIVSPSFMIQRPMAADARVIPVVPTHPAATPDAVKSAEDVAFDKADAAERRSALERERDEIGRQLVTIEGDADGGPDRGSNEVVREIARLRAEKTRIDAELESIEEDSEGD